MSAWTWLRHRLRAPERPDLRVGVQDMLALMPEGFSEEDIAELRSIGVSAIVSSWKKGEPQWNTWTTLKAATQGLEVCPWVFACIFRIMLSAMGVPWVVQVEGDEGWELEPKHGIARLLRRPNEVWSRQYLFALLIMYLYLTGEAFVPIVRDGRGAAHELWVLSRDNVAPVPKGGNSGRDVEGYKIKTADGRELPGLIAPADMIHIQFPDPLNPYAGFAPLKAAGRAVDTDVKASTWQYKTLDNNAVPAGAWVVKGVLSQASFDRIRELLDEEYQGAANARRPMIMGNVDSWQKISLSAQELDYIESRKLTRQQICAALGVPPTMIGVYEEATLANLEASRTSFWQDTIMPLLGYIGDWLTLGLLPQNGQAYRLSPDERSTPAFLATFKTKVDTATKLFQMGYAVNTINRALQLGFPAIEGGDRGYLLANMVPVDMLDDLARLKAQQVEAGNQNTPGSSAAKVDSPGTKTE